MPPLRRLLLALGCTVALQAAAEAPAPHSLIVPEAASGLTRVETVRASHYLAATNNPHGTEAARAILARGGSAADAAIAAQLVLGLTEPQSSGLGGGAFVLFWDAESQRLRFYDGRETAPAGVDRDYFLNDSGEPEDFLGAVIGGHAVGVPGVVKLMALLHERHGRLPWAALFEPAIRLAEEGFPLSPRLHTLLTRTPRVAVNDAISRYFFQADGTPKPVGTRLRNPDYAATLRLLAEQGEAVFYQGEIGRDIVRAVRSNPNRPGPLALTDLAGYRAVERTPICAPYRRYRVCGAPPPSSGGTTVLAILGMLQRFSPEQLTPGTGRFEHLFVEASRLAFADRNTWVADPGFAEVPTAALVDRAYLARRAGLIDPQRAAPEVHAGSPAELGVGAAATAGSPELVGTSHISLVDAEGNALSMTTSIETAFGSRLLVRGFLLNNQLTDFSFTPTDARGAPVANRIEPFKRPRSSMAPTMVFRDNEPVLLLGSPGGSRIIPYVAKPLVLALDGHMPLDKAIASPHITALGAGVELEEAHSSTTLQGALEALGHTVRLTPQTSGLNGIRREGEGWVGAVDPRREGTAAGE
jgi:gamma-glutamyltranspeptidase/glutathione hydrolase